MIVRIKYILVLVSLLVLMKTNAQENLDSLLRISAENNPLLKSMFSKYMADLQKVSQVGALPDPDLSFGYFVKPMELVNGNQLAEIQFMQMFPWFGTLKASKDEASAMALSSYELFRAEKEELFYKVRNAYSQLFAIQKQLQTYDTTIFLLKSIEGLLMANASTTGTTDNPAPLPSNNVAKNDNLMGMGSPKPVQKAMPQMNEPSMSGGRSAFADLLRVQVEIKVLEDDIASLGNKKQIIIIQLNTLLNRTPDLPIQISENLDFPFFDFHNMTLFDSIKMNNPMIRMNESDLSAYQAREKMNRKMGYPMIGMGLNYMVINKSAMVASDMNGKDMIMPMFTVKIPVYRKKYNASIAEARYMGNSAKEKLDYTESMLFMEFSEYRFALIDAERKIRLYEELISLTTQSFDLMLVQFSTSGADFEALIRLHRQLLDYRLNVFQAQADRFSAMAGLQKLLSKN